MGRWVEGAFVANCEISSQERELDTIRLLDVPPTDSHKLSKKPSS